MLVVETIAKIRRAFFKQGKSIKAICQELGVSRKVVRKVIRSGVTEFRYEREDQPLPKIGRWRDNLDQLLFENEAKALRVRLCHSRKLFVRAYPRCVSPPTKGTPAQAIPPDRDGIALSCGDSCDEFPPRWHTATLQERSTTRLFELPGLFRDPLTLPMPPYL